MFSFLKNLFKKKQPQPRPTLPVPKPCPTAPVPAAPTQNLGTGATPKAREDWARQAAQKIDPGATSEELCGITENMSKEEISAQLAMLYRRHNRAASSLEASLREEAEIMLEVIAMMREKYTL
jgi:hypothetical protein